MSPVASITQFGRRPSVGGVVTRRGRRINIARTGRRLHAQHSAVFTAGFFRLIANPRNTRSISSSPGAVTLYVVSFGRTGVDDSASNPPTLVRRVFGGANRSNGFHAFHGQLLFLLTGSRRLSQTVSVAHRFGTIHTVLHDRGHVSSLSRDRRSRVGRGRKSLSLKIQITLAGTCHRLFCPTGSSIGTNGKLVRCPLPTRSTDAIGNGHGRRSIILGTLGSYNGIHDRSTTPCTPTCLLRGI